MNGEAIAALSLINSVHIEEQDFMNILSQCRATLTDSNRNDEIVDNNQPEPSSDDKKMVKNMIIFAINSLILDSIKNNISPSSLVRILQEHKLDCTSDNFKLLITFINSIWDKVLHNMNHLELNPTPRFKEIEWAQILNVKSSSMDNIKEKTYLIDLHVQDQMTNRESTFSMTLLPKELQDLHTNLLACAKSIENCINK